MRSLSENLALKVRTTDLRMHAPLDEGSDLPVELRSRP
jgi:hypothetical protein